MFTTCLDADGAVIFVHAASAAYAASSVPPDPALAVMPDGRPCCKNVGTHAPASRRITRSNRADRTPAPENLRSERLGAGPRTLPLRQLASPPARGAADDNAGLVPAGAPDPAALPASAGRLANAATVALPAGRAHCNSGFGDAAADTTVRSPSKDNAAVGHGNRLVLDQTREDTEVVPRERELPGVKPRSGACDSSSGRCC
jgi:hypothetical protein